MDKNIIVEEDVLEVTDTETSETQVYTTEDLYRIIKEQSEKIAELTRELAVQFETSVDSAEYHKLWEENQQLKEKYEFCHSDLRGKIDYIHELDEIIEQLKQSQKQQSIAELKKRTSSNRESTGIGL